MKNSSTGEKLNLEYMAELIEVALEDNQNINLSSESARKKLADELVGKFLTAILLMKK